jgi:hypothetical protein
MKNNNKNIDAIVTKIKKNIHGDFLCSQKWETDNYDSCDKSSSCSSDPEDFVELSDFLMAISPSLPFSDYLQINNMIKLKQKEVVDCSETLTENCWEINLNDLLSFLEIKGYIKKEDFSYLLEDKFRKILYKDFDKIINELPQEIKEKINDGILYSSPFTISYYHHHDNVPDERYIDFEDLYDCENFKKFPEFDQFIKEIVPNIKFDDYLCLKRLVMLRELETSELDNEHLTKISSKYCFKINIKNVIVRLRREMNYYI